MTKPLLGGSAAAIALLFTSLTFYAEPSVAEPLARTSQEPQTQPKKDPQLDAFPEGRVPPEILSEAAARAWGDPAAPDAPEGITTATHVPAPEPEGAPQPFVATAYSLRGRTASGQYVRKGVIAADRRILPLGTRVRLQAGPYSGEYVVADTGGAIRGRKIDIWMPSTGEAMRFGRRSIKLTVLTKPRPKAARAALARKAK